MMNMENYQRNDEKSMEMMTDPSKMMEMMSEFMKSYVNPSMWQDFMKKYMEMFANSCLVSNCLYQTAFPRSLLSPSFHFSFSS